MHSINAQTIRDQVEEYGKTWGLTTKTYDRHTDQERVCAAEEIQVARVVGGITCIYADVVGHAKLSVEHPIAGALRARVRNFEKQSLEHRIEAMRKKREKDLRDRFEPATHEFANEYWNMQMRTKYVQVKK